MPMIDWNEAALSLKRDVRAHGGFLSMQRDVLRERFDIGRLAENNTEELLDTLEQHGLIVWPHPRVGGTSLRVYDVETDIGKIAQAIVYPQEVPETALVDAANLCARADAGKRRRSVSVPWLTAFDVFLQLVVGRPPDEWEELDDEREPYQLVTALIAALELRTDIINADTIRIAGAVCACRPRAARWDHAAQALGVTFAEAARRQKETYQAVLREAAKHLLGGAEVPTREVDLGQLGLRYCREARGGIGWLR